MHILFLCFDRKRVTKGTGMPCAGYFENRITLLSYEVRFEDMVVNKDQPMKSLEFGISPLILFVRSWGRSIRKSQESGGSSIVHS
jgi:hypothetical protein